MSNILKNDVQTYVRELIERGFEPNRIKEKDQMGNQPFYAEEPQEGQHPPIGNSWCVKE